MAYSAPVFLLSIIKSVSLTGKDLCLRRRLYLSSDSSGKKANGTGLALNCAYNTGVWNTKNARQNSKKSNRFGTISEFRINKGAALQIYHFRKINRLLYSGFYLEAI